MKLVDEATVAGMSLGFARECMTLARMFRDAAENNGREKYSQMVAIAELLEGMAIYEFMDDE